MDDNELAANAFASSSSATPRFITPNSQTFLFRFCNSYSSFIYIGFIKQLVEGGCLNGMPCMEELRIQLATIFITQIVVGNTVEVLSPMLEVKAKMMMENMKTKSESLSKAWQIRITRPNVLNLNAYHMTTNTTQHNSTQLNQNFRKNVSEHPTALVSFLSFAHVFASCY